MNGVQRGGIGYALASKQPGDGVAEMQVTGGGPMVNVSWVPSVIADTASRLVEAIKSGDFTPGSTVWLAVTGLSRSGKTVFITSLVHNLLSALHNPNRMPLLRVVGEGRMIAARLDGAKTSRLPRFPYFDNIEVMAGGSPDWPARTDDISEIGI